ncbi:MAG: ATP-binding protein [Chloroflexota bacterium]
MDALQVPGILDSLAAIRAYVRTVSEQAGVDKKRTYRLQLAIDEVATNIVSYGYDNGALQGDIVVDVEINPRRLTITLKDTAPPFNPFAKKSPGDLTQPLDTRPVGGLGVFLAFKNVDEFRYVYEDGQNQNIFVLRLDQVVETQPESNP